MYFTWPAPCWRTTPVTNEVFILITTVPFSTYRRDRGITKVWRPFEKSSEIRETQSERDFPFEAVDISTSNRNAFSQSEYKKKPFSRVQTKTLKIASDKSPSPYLSLSLSLSLLLNFHIFNVLNGRWKCLWVFFLLQSNPRVWDVSCHGARLTFWPCIVEESQ